MNTTKKINVNVSSLVGLKAELLRKHTEVKDAKAKIDISKPILPKVKVKNKPIKVKNNGEKKIEKRTEIEDVNTLKKSKYMLMAKSRLYDKLKKNRGDCDDNYLVDFKNKYYESSENESSIEDNDYEDTNIDPEEDWVDYEDCFGRTRKCLRKDLPGMKKKDSLIEREIAKESPLEQKEELPAFIPPEKEPEIEIMRKKWEEQTEKISHKTDIHYQDILFDEARTHGVGYYAFSHDEDERAKQQSNLTQLRKETEQKQKELQEIKNMKSKMEENRLKTARIRARIRAGLPPEPTEDEIKNDSPEIESLSTNEALEVTSSDTEKTEKNREKSESNEQDSLIVIENKIKAFGELLGKRLPRRELSQEEWIDKRRKDRLGEFAPVYENFKSGGILVGNKYNQLTTKINNDDDDPLQTNAGGPEPTDIWESAMPASLDNNTDTANTLDNSNTIFPSPQSNIPFNVAVSLPQFQSVPPPSFNPTVPPPSVVGSVSSLPTPAVNNNFISSPAVFYPVPPPSVTNYTPLTVMHSSSMLYSSNISQMPSTTMTNVEPRRSSDSDSDDSNIIGPMPLPSSSFIQDDIVSRIPLPDHPPPTETQNCTPSSLNNIEENQLENSKIDKIAAGLKYLRQKFEQNDTS